MTKFVEVKIRLDAVVLVEIDNDESIDDAIKYASDEYSNVDGDVTASSSGIVDDGFNLESLMRHADKKLML